MVNLKKVLLAATLSAVCLNSYAAALKIGVINVRELMAKAPNSQAIGQQLQNEFAKRQEELQAVAKLVMDKQEKLQRDRDVIGADQRKALEKEIFNAQRDYKKMEQELREDQMIRNREETEKLLKVVSTKVNEFAAKEHYSLILHRDTAPFVADDLDVTQQVIALMQGKAK